MLLFQFADLVTQTGRFFKFFLVYSLLHLQTQGVQPARPGKAALFLVIYQFFLLASRFLRLGGGFRLGAALPLLPRVPGRAHPMLTLLLTFLALGALVGVLAGLLGIGGGLVLVAALAWLLPQYGIPREAAMHAALASSLGSIVLTSLSSTRAHHRRGSVLWPSVAWLVPGVMVGAWLGSRFAIGLDGAVLRWAFVGYCLLIAAQMAFSRGPAAGESAPAPRGPRMTLAGGGIGAVSAVVGIGGGSLTVPLLTWLGVAPIRAVGTAAA